MNVKDRATPCVRSNGTGKTVAMKMVQNQKSKAVTHTKFIYDPPFVSRMELRTIARSWTCILINES